MRSIGSPLRSNAAGSAGPSGCGWLLDWRGTGSYRTRTAGVGAWNGISDASDRAHQTMTTRIQVVGPDGANWRRQRLANDNSGPAPLRWNYGPLPRRRRIVNHYTRVPLVPRTGTPAPSVVRYEEPTAVAIWSPAPRIRRNPNISLPGVKGPVAVRIRVPTHPN